MKVIFRCQVAMLLIFACFSSALPCGPSYITPIFEYERAPENPYENFAAGKIGIIKPTNRRVVLIAAYRYLNGGGFSDAEQKALVEVWNAEFKNEPYKEDEIGETVKKWVEKRRSVVGKEEKTPEIYVERAYGGYDFFPNCTKNAFEVAVETLDARVASHGSDDRHVANWIKAQDKVFENCASGKSTPDAANEEMPDWLKKDRAYQLAAAEFYSLDFDSARRRFAEIAQDYDSPWRETAEYLVGRTLIRQSSLVKDKTRANLLLIEAEQNLSMVAARGGKYADSAEKMLGLVKYRLRPQERVRELALSIAAQGGANFRQDLIDYNWLLDKFEREALEAEEQRKLEEAERKAVETYGNLANAPKDAVPTVRNANADTNSNTQTPDESDLRIILYSDDYKENWTFYVKPDATDDEVIAQAEQIYGKPLTDKMKEHVRDARKSAYQGRFDGTNGAEYQGGYYGTETLSPSLLPDHLSRDELTNWLFTFQMTGSEAYLHALSQYRQTDSVLWLLTAFSKAEKSSTELARLFDAADRLDRQAPAYPTIAYHQARILIGQNKIAEARKMIEEILDSNLDLPVSSRNKFLLQRAMLSETLDDFLKFAQIKAFAFDMEGTSGTVEQFIKEYKGYYSPESYPNKTREEYEKDIEEGFAHEKLWQNRTMFDAATVEMMNQHFALPLLIEAQKSPALPEYLRERFAVAIWTRAVLFNDWTTVQKISGDIVRFHPELRESLDQLNMTKTPVGKQRAAFYLILKNPMFTPYLENGFEETDNEFGSLGINDWWCAPYDPEFDQETKTDVPRNLPPRPLFLTAAHSNAAQMERRKLRDVGDAPKFLGEKMLEWSRLAPTDRRVPEALYITWEANGWTKYGCGNNIELRQEISNTLKKKYPRSEWTQKAVEQEKAEN